MGIYFVGMKWRWWCEIYSMYYRPPIAGQYDRLSLDCIESTICRIDLDTVLSGELVGPAKCKVARSDRAMWVNADSQNSRSQLQWVLISGSCER
jgi:hypothetical protein